MANDDVDDIQKLLIAGAAEVNPPELVDQDTDEEPDEEPIDPLDKTVYLNVYEHKKINGFLFWMPADLRVYHTAVQVFGREFTFVNSYMPVCTITEMSRPRNLEKMGPSGRNFKYIDTVIIGRTQMDQVDFNQLICELTPFWLGSKYNLLTFNCHNFAEELCFRLCGKRLEGRYNTLAEIARRNPMIHTLLQGTF